MQTVQCGPKVISCSQWVELLDELNIGAFTVDLQRGISSINYCAQALIGMRAEEVVGQDCREVFCGVPCMVSCLLGDQMDVDAEEPDIELFDERDRRHLLTRLATPIFGPDRKMAGCLTILQDHSPIADLINRVHYEERSLKLILDHLDVGIFTVNRGGLITFFNTAAEKISGYHRKQILGEPCTSAFDQATAPDLALLNDCIANGQPRSTPKGQMITAEGVTIPVRANYMALRNEKGSIIGGLTTFHDLSLVQQLNQAISDRYSFHDMIGKSPAMQKIFEMVGVVAASHATVLIEGATGTGKDLLAKVIHSASPRAGRTMVKVNCAAIPDNLLESELFGYVKGAFTGADRDKPGRFQLAEGSTILLDEIGDMPPSLQAKLLRVLEDKEFYPLGARQTVKVNVRIIAATNRPLDTLVAQGHFREDLFYRLNVLRIQLPPLKERKEDLPLLISHLRRKLCTARGQTAPTIAEKAMEVLLNYDYPGNVRELENILEHALIICNHQDIEPEHLPVLLYEKMALKRIHAPARRDLQDRRHQRERNHILNELERCGGNKARAARALGINRTTLWRKMKRLGIPL